MRGLSGKIAFVTGGASGIGAATAKRLAEEGTRVAVADIDFESAQLIAKEIEGIAVPIDVTRPDSVTAAFAAAVDVTGSIDILVNNAGGDRAAMFVDTDAASWDRAIDLNLKGTIACTHAAFPSMIDRRAGSIVNVSSEAGRAGTIAGALYAATKAGVLGFTKAIAREGAAFGIRCNAVTPGPTDTPMLSELEASGRFGAAIRQGMVDATVMKRTACPEEVAASIAFLASEDASYITGHTLSVSGGAVMI